MELRVLDAVDVDRLETQVAAAALDLVAQEARLDRVVAVDDPLRVDQAGVDVGLVHVAAHVGPRAHEGRIRRDVAALGDDADLVALGLPLGDASAERRAQRPLAGLHAVRQGGVEDVDAAVERADHRLAVGQVVAAPDLAVAHAEPDRREREPVGAAEVPGPAGEALGKAPGALVGRAAGQGVGVGHARVT